MPPKFTIFFILLLITLVSSYVRSCEYDQMQQGCRIFNAQCSCGYGCKSEFRYSNLADCKEAMRGKADICSQIKPCLNNGACSQISKSPGYKCHCQGTGFYGARCEKSCLKKGPIIYECIVI